ncbi:ChaN family lipoprotein [Desulfopila sp. IMCC35008]|uniref:ChaN family lipoprotein n=1 Tax=Desulfopila sp. IMCC35008 TaxID=2653858 RepID=UPI0013D7CE6A|nr:ChaN family lipoprotein [Desulfopila sp. IMCC35008]
MKTVHKPIYRVLYIFLTSLLLIQAEFVTARPDPPDYQLAVSFNLEQALLTGTAQISLPADQPLRLNTRGLDITGIVIEQENGITREAHQLNSVFLEIPADHSARTIYISYSKNIQNDHTNRIAGDGITLLSSWYPQPDQPVMYRLAARLPINFNAISQTDSFPLKRIDDTVYTSLSTPRDAIHFVAAPYVIKEKQIRDGLSVYTLFYSEDDTLADSYLEKCRDLILRYEKEIGPFPYNHYIVAANKLPTGLSMGSFSLFGQNVLRLPFIVDSSLGHEIVHAWFGNAVGVDQQAGNWCEGLTSYLADHAFRQDINEGENYRKENIINYLSYINPENVIPLANFISANHAGDRDKSNRAVGYSRSMLLFHELRSLLGSEIFSDGIKTFYTDFKGKSASWYDLENVFENVSNRNLRSFFNQRLSRLDIPDLLIHDAELKVNVDGTSLLFTILQATESPYSLQLPIQVTTGTGYYYFKRDIVNKTTRIELKLPELPMSFTIDPEYSMLRTLSDSEIIPSWSRFLGSGKKLTITESAETRAAYEPILSHLAHRDWTVKHDSEVSNEELAHHDLLFLGTDQKSYRSLFGGHDPNTKGFSLEVRTNPLNPNRVAVLMNTTDLHESKAVAYRLGHYGKYSSLYFENGKILEKKIATGDKGITFHFEERPRGAAVPTSNSFDQLIIELSKKKVIYIGESHTSASDHRLQLRLIEALSAKVPQLAIGMEMFPTSSQPALDNYTLGDGTMSEQSFLKESDYFAVWSYDYRYFREIFTLARQKKIPVIGLNLERRIVSTVFRTGNTDQIGKELQKALPLERDLDLPGYGERLSQVYAVHDAGNHGMGTRSGFIQAQALWDETMAKNIADYLKNHPGTMMVVLAGTQHTRKDSGIPPRVARRINVDQASVLNLSGESIPANMDQVADYYFLSRPYELPTAGKMGIVLESYQQEGGNYIRIEQITHASKAGEAGLKQGDTIISINDVPLSSMEDIRIAMLDAQPGDFVTITARRPGISSRISTKVELIGPKPSGHP